LACTNINVQKIREIAPGVKIRIHRSGGISTEEEYFLDKLASIELMEV